jgi:hypothetical protein
MRGYAVAVRRMVVLALVVTAVAVAATVALAAQSPKALRDSMLAAAKTQHSVHYATRTVVGNALLTLAGDVAATNGRQQVGMKVGKATGHATILVLDQTAYVQGNANGLQFLLGLTKAQASSYAGRWISILRGDKHYNQTAGDVTLGSFLQSITPHGRLAALKGKVRGRRVVGVKATSGTGKRKELQVLAAPATGKRLPLEEDELSPGRAYISHTAMSKWNEPVQVPAPANSVPLTTVVGQ